MRSRDPNQEPLQEPATPAASWWPAPEKGQILSIERQTSPNSTACDQHLSENLPPRTVVKWVLHPAKGSHIQAEMWLPDPDRWNGRFLGLGNGGAAGSINPDAFLGPISENFAVATTDMGTAPGADSGVGNPEVWRDFGYRATHLMTVTSKQMLEAFYDRSPAFSYFTGGSTGGQQALQEAQRYPEDYDGIVAHIPAHCRTPLHAYFLWNDQILSRCRFTEPQQAAIIAAGNAHLATREAPAVAGKFLSDHRGTAADIDAVVKLAMNKAPNLTAEQADGLRKLFEGPRHAVTGERIFCGIPFGSSLEEAHGNLYLFQWVFGRDKDLQQINFAADIDAYTAALGPFLNAENADLRRFAARGGKLIMTPGSADSVVPYHASIDYYERVIAACGGLEAARSFIRLFIIPGMDHGSGPGINRIPSTLDLVMNWRENGIAPDVIAGKRVVEGRTEYEMPIYPYPTQARWSPESGSYHPVEGLRGGVDPIAERFRPPPSE
jgi:feruloyl esterase